MIDYLLEVAFPTDAATEERLHGLLFFTRATGSSSADKDGQTTVSIYFDSAADRDAAIAVLRKIDGASFSPDDRPRVDWLELYEQSLEPIFIGRRFVVAPTAELLPGDDIRIGIVIPQEQAFGTGSHASTALCLEMLESIPVAEKSCLDIGSGSAILAIGMVRLGARKVVAFDNDRDAFAAMRENRTRNAVAPHRMPLFIGSLDALRGGRFEVIAMNIIPGVIVRLLPNAVARMAPDGVLILSGILATQRDFVVDECRERGLQLDREQDRGEWWCGVFVAPRAIPDPPAPRTFSAAIP